MRSSEIAQALGGRLLGKDDDLLQAAPLFMAQAFDLSAILYPKDIRWAKRSNAGAILTDVATAADYADEIPSPLIVIEDYFDAFLKLKELFSSLRPKACPVIEDCFIHPSAQIGRAFIGQGSQISAHAVISDGAVIESDCVIGAGVVIEGQVHIGQGTIIKANTVIGSEGFVPFGEKAQNLSCLGRVVIEPQVRIGALCSIDRGLLGATTISKGVMIDNMVHIGHDSIVGENTIIAGQSGLAGFARLGKDITCGGQVGIAPQVVVGDGARISGKSMVHCDIGPQEIWSGNPSMPHSIYLRTYARTKLRAKK